MQGKGSRGCPRYATVRGKQYDAQKRGSGRRKKVAPKDEPVDNIREHTEDVDVLSKSYLLLLPWGLCNLQNTYPEFSIQFIAYP